MTYMPMCGIGFESFASFVNVIHKSCHVRPMSCQPLCRGASGPRHRQRVASSMDRHHGGHTRTSQKILRKARKMRKSRAREAEEQTL